ncbi:MAG TPA: hypothetical protein VFH54_17480 [Mycobacteriales bacterium]|nr:hypothetical protein [Mycobacteriales bacterium]
MWDLANEYLGWFAVECHYTPDQVFDMPWVPLVRLTLALDDIAEQRKKHADQSKPGNFRRMT